MDGWILIDQDNIKCLKARWGKQKSKMVRNCKKNPTTTGICPLSPPPNSHPEELTTIGKCT